MRIKCKQNGRPIHATGVLDQSSKNLGMSVMYAIKVANRDCPRLQFGSNVGDTSDQFQEIRTLVMVVIRRMGPMLLVSDQPRNIACFESGVDINNGNIGSTTVQHSE